MNSIFHLPNSPKRIVSLVPSLTELLFDLGLDEEVVGITKFCIHPDNWYRKKERVGGTKTVKTDVVKSLQPDLILANKEENVKEQIEELEQIAPVWVSNIKTLDDAIEMILFVGMLVHKEDRSSELVRQIQIAFTQIIPLQQKINTAYLIWKDPYMAAGGDTFIHDLLGVCGFENIFKNINRYPEIFIKPVINTQQPIDKNTSAVNNSPSSVNSHLSTNNYQLTTQKCQLLLLSSEPYPFKQNHLEDLCTLLPATRIMLVDGEMFSWYGSRLLHAAKYLKNLVQQIQEQ